MRNKRRSARQQGPETAHAVPDPERSLEYQAKKIARMARAQGFTCITELGDERNRYMPRILIEVWDKEEDATA